MLRGVLIILAFVIAGCGPTIRPSFDSAEPAARNQALVRAAATNDQNAVPDLVRMLESDDPATRLLAIDALERLTGQRLGYDPADSERKREEAVVRWRAFANDYRPRGGAGAAP